MYQDAEWRGYAAFIFEPQAFSACKHRENNSICLYFCRPLYSGCCHGKKIYR